MTENEGKERQAIWGVRKKHEFWFYTALLIFGVAVAVFTLWKERYEETWLEIFDILWDRIFGSVVFVWFIYQAFDWFASGIRFWLMSAGDFFRQQIRRRKEEDQKRKEELQENGRREGRKEERDSLRKYIETVRQKKTFSAEDMLRFLEDLEKDRKD